MASAAALLCLLACLSHLVPLAAAALPDDRGWELVSPVEKNGGEIAAPGALSGGGVLQAASDGQSVTYGSSASFGADPLGAPPASQYLSIRSAVGWSTKNISLPLLSGSYGTEPEGVPYQLFSTELARALHLNRYRCEVGNPCPRDYYLRENTDGALTVSPREPDLAVAATSLDLRHVVLSTCAALTADAVEVPLGDGCDPAKPNLYKWSAGVLTLINLLPAQSQGTPGATLAAQSGAVSGDGSRVYFRDLVSGDLYLRQGTQTRQVDAAAGGGGSFETASADGAVGYFTAAGHLWRYSALADSATDLTPAGGVAGVLGASADGTRVYFQDGGGLRLWQGGATATVATGPNAADAGNYPPTTGSARVSADGARLAFISTQPLTGYNNANQKTGIPEPEVFLYDATASQLRCVSCRPTGTRPIGASTIPGSVANGERPDAPDTYKPRVLSADGRRLFFDSGDALVGTDTNNDVDVYQWEAQGAGSCVKASGCVELISSGRSEDGARFADASLDGSSAFFLTDGSLVRSDPGAVDLYVARIGGGFPDPLDPIPCNGDSCQVLPPEPVDPGLSTLGSGPGNPAISFREYRRRGHGRCRRVGARKCPRSGKGQKSKGRKGGKQDAGARHGGGR